jgi:hypothetical protein
MKVIVREKYYKRSEVGREPAKFHAEQPKGIGTNIHAIVTLDPVLKKHKDLHKAIMKHEVTEIKHWGEGNTGSHHHARRKEPHLTRNIGGVSGFWKEIKRRERR